MCRVEEAWAEPPHREIPPSPLPTTYTRLLQITQNWRTEFTHSSLKQDEGQGGSILLEVGSGPLY